MTIKLALTTDEAATATGLSPDTIKKAIRAGKLPAKRSGETNEDGKQTGRYLIKVDSLRDWLDGLEDA